MRKAVIAAALLLASGRALAEPSTGVVTLDASVSITTGSAAVFKVVMDRNTLRQGCVVQNPTTATEAIYVGVGLPSAVTQANSFTLAPGMSFSCVQGGVVIIDSISVSAATNPHPIIAKQQ